jgi:hypothetical protein
LRNLYLSPFALLLLERLAPAIEFKHRSETGAKWFVLTRRCDEHRQTKTII